MDLGLRELDPVINSAKLMVGILKNVDAVICVSHTGYVLLSIKNPYFIEIQLL